METCAVVGIPGPFFRPKMKKTIQTVGRNMSKSLWYYAIVSVTLEKVMYTPIVTLMQRLRWVFTVLQQPESPRLQTSMHFTTGQPKTTSCTHLMLVENSTDTGMCVENFECKYTTMMTLHCFTPSDEVWFLFCLNFPNCPNFFLKRVCFFEMSWT